MMIVMLLVEYEYSKFVYIIKFGEFLIIELFEIVLFDVVLIL